MLISPLRIQHDLSAVTCIPGSSSGPHTALLILPEGRLLASATKYNDELPVNGGQPNEPDGDEEGGDDDEQDVEEEGDEPYLDEPERMRLLCGLASQWEEDESPRVECELGRLLLTPIYLPPPEPPISMSQNLPSTKGLQPKMFVLVLNATKETAWSDLTAKAEVFRKAWKAMGGV